MEDFVQYFNDRVLTTVKGSGDDSTMKINLRDVPRKFVESVTSMLGLAQDISDKDLRSKLDVLLYNTIPAFGFISEVRPNSSTVYYCTYPSDNSDRVYYKQSFKVNEDESVELTGAAEEVTPRMTWELVSAATDDSNDSDNEIVRGACECQNNNGDKEIVMTEAEKKELAKRLIASGMKLDEATIIALDDKVLQALSETTNTPESTETTDTATTKETPATATDAKTENAASATPAPPKTEVEWLSTAPKEVQESYRQMQATSAAYHKEQAQKAATLREQIKACTNVYTDERLAKMELEDLDTLYRALNANYEGVGLRLSADEVSSADSWDPYDLKGLREARQKENNQVPTAN
jgi:hypothetical protein